MSLLLLNGATAVNSAPSNTAATGTITAVAGSALVDGETFTITSRRGARVTFEFDSNSSYTAGNVQVAFTAGDTNATVATAIAAAISGVASLGLSSAAVGATVTNTARLPGPEWNAGLTETVANGTFAVTDVTGGLLAGFALQGSQPGQVQRYWQKVWDTGVISVNGAGTGALTYQGKVWLMDPITFVWAPAGISATIADRGLLNDGTTITGTTTLVHTEMIEGLSAKGRIYLETTVITGTNMTVSATLEPRAV